MDTQEKGLSTPSEETAPSGWATSDITWGEIRRDTPMMVDENL